MPVDFETKITYYITDSLDLYFYITDENEDLISGDDWDEVQITVKDDFNATSPEIILESFDGDFTTYSEGTVPGNVHFFIPASSLATIRKGLWEYRVVLIKDAVEGESLAEQVTAVRGSIYAI